MINRISQFYRDVRQAQAIVERSSANACNGIWDGDVCQVCTKLKRTISNALETTTFGKGDAHQARAILKCPLADACDGVGDDDVRYTGTFVKCIITDARDRVGNHQSGYQIPIQVKITRVMGIIEWMIFKRIQLDFAPSADVADVYTRQVPAIFECVRTNACNGIGDGNACQARAAVERMTADVCDTVLNIDGFNI